MIKHRNFSLEEGCGNLVTTLVYRDRSHGGDYSWSIMSITEDGKLIRHRNIHEEVGFSKGKKGRLKLQAE